jgi:NAD(P)-dependent dehydrogenase (short-subunit alcohol dehydrogenase family)
MASSHKAEKKRIAFVTGGNRGVGLGTAIGLGKRGVAVVIGVRTQAQGEEALRVLQDKDITASYLLFDVCKEEDHDRAYGYFADKYGKLDILVNNAGIMLEGPRTELDLPNTTLVVSDTALRKTFDVNFFGVVALTQKLLPLIQRSEAGRIVNVSSILGSLQIHATSDDPRLPNHRQFAYNVSKTAMNAFTIHLAQTLRDSGIKVNAAHPGWVRTSMGGDNAELDIEEGAETSVELAMLEDDGPTCVYRHRSQTIPW